MRRKFSVFGSISFGAPLVIAVFCIAGPRCLADDIGLSGAQLRGQDIYRNGASHGMEIGARLQGDITVSARDFPCANCHGLDGEGRKEGELNTPSLRWEILGAARTMESSLRDRPPYTEASVRRAISAGIDSVESLLNPAMPRYQMDDEQLTDLIAYLKVLGSDTDSDPGLSGTTIRIGTVLPLTGPLAAIGANVRAVLEAYFVRVNNAGGIYGRKIELVVSDSRGEAEESIAAMNKLIDRQHVFAFIANYVPNGAHMEDQLTAAQVPLVAPISFMARSDKVNRYRFDILPSFADQARCLVAFAHAHQTTVRSELGGVETAGTAASTRRFAVMHGDGALDLDAMSGFSAQIMALNIAAPVEFRYRSNKFSVASAEEFLKKNRPDYVFFFGAADGLKASITIAITNSLPTRFLTATAMSSDLAFSASDDAIDRVWFAQALPLSDKVLATLIALEKEARFRITNQAFGAAAYAAAEVFTEAVKRGGRRLSRARLVDALESFRDFKTDFVPPITFGSNQRAGLAGCVITRINPQTRRYDSISDWITLEAIP